MTKEEEDEVLYKEINKRIQNYRNKIKKNMEEYNLFRQTSYISTELFDFYRNYLLEQINKNIKELKELVEHNNE